MRRNRGLETVVAWRLTLELEGTQDLDRLVARKIDAQTSFYLGHVQLDHLRRQRGRITIDDALGDRAAGVLTHQLRGAQAGRLHRLRMNALAEADARLARQVELLHRA